MLRTGLEDTFYLPGGEKAASNATLIEARSSDVRDADAMLRRLDLPLRAPDAIHIAIALRRGQ